MPKSPLQINFLRCLSLVLLSCVTSLAGSLAQAKEHCPSDAPSLLVDERTHVYTAKDPTVWFMIEPFEAQWLLMEAQSATTAETLPTLRVYDADCELMMAHATSARIEGRWISRTTSAVPAYLRIENEGASRELWINAWTVKRSAVLTLQAPGDRHKDGEEEEPDPIPDEPVDEWDESRSTPLDDPGFVEIPGWGLWESVGSATPWCPWTRQPHVLGTLTCARSVQIESASRLEVQRLVVDGPEWLRLELDQAGSLTLLSHGISHFYDAQGRPLGSWRHGETVPLFDGTVFVRLGARGWLPDERTVEMRFDLD